MNIELRRQELELRKRLLIARNKLINYEHDNKIEFFDVYDEARYKRHQECCKLFRGANPPQKELLEAWKDDKYKVFTFTGGNRRGKTTIGVVIALSVLFGKWLWNNEEIKFKHKLPRKVRYVGQDWEKHIKTVVEVEIENWYPKNREVETKKNNFGIRSFWEDQLTKGTLEIMSNSQDSEQHEGWSGDLIVYDEPPKRDIRVANARGLTDRLGREVFCMTLLKEAWVDREVIKALNGDGTPDLSVYNNHGSIYDNVGYGLTDEGVADFRKKLRPDEINARIDGVPSYMSGLIYPQFDRQINIKKRFKVPLDWIIDIAIDFHPSKAWAVLFLATGKNGFKYCVNEIWEKGSWKYICEQILRLIKDNNYRMGNMIIDPLSKGDSQSDLNEESVYDKMSQYFLSYGHLLYTASKDKEGGIHLVQDLLMTENEMPALFFFEDLKRTIFEIEGYMRDPETGKPIKEDDDMMENLYRLALLNTQWCEMRDIEDDFVQTNTKKNSITGY